jgi:hypothetical protein
MNGSRRPRLSTEHFSDYGVQERVDGAGNGERTVARLAVALRDAQISGSAGAGAGAAGVGPGATSSASTGSSAASGGFGSAGGGPCLIVLSALGLGTWALFKLLISPARWRSLTLISPLERPG